MRWRLQIAAAAAILALITTGLADPAFARKKQCTPHTEWPGGNYYWEKRHGHWECVEPGYGIGPDCTVIDVSPIQTVDQSKCGSPPPKK